MERAEEPSFGDFFFYGVLLTPGSLPDPTDDCFKNSCSTKMAQQAAGCHELDVAQPQYI